MDLASLAARFSAIESRIRAACERAGRSRSAVRLVGASKFQPLTALAATYDLGLRCFGENRVQEGAAKATELPGDIEWHLLGPLQSNKVRKAVSIFRVVHAVDRLAIALELDSEAARQERPLAGFVEVNLGAEESKHGFAAEGLIAALAPLASLSHLEIRGLMAIPPPGATAEDSRPHFRRLAALRDELATRPEWRARLFAGELSMGMSDDFEIAIEEGATHVRIGSALFGDRA
ncbi:MAG: YggS family pyridoxal phosphate-dependent enzyme [Thermoanaerobaculia bacterium]